MILQLCISPKIHVELKAKYFFCSKIDESSLFAVALATVWFKQSTSSVGKMLSDTSSSVSTTSSPFIHVSNPTSRPTSRSLPGHSAESDDLSSFPPLLPPLNTECRPLRPLPGHSLGADTLASSPTTRSLPGQASKLDNSSNPVPPPPSTLPPPKRV